MYFKKFIRNKTEWYRFFSNTNFLFLLRIKIRKLILCYDIWLRYRVTQEGWDCKDDLKLKMLSQRKKQVYNSRELWI